MSVPETKIAKLRNGTALAYLDSGVANGSESMNGHKTVIFIHGATFNKHCWDFQFTHLPPNVRAIAYSERGYDKSTPFKSQEVESGAGLLQDDAEDLSAFIDYCSADLGVEGAMTLVCWSQGGILPLAASYYNLPLKNVSSVVFYEPPNLACWQLPPDEEAIARWTVVALNPNTFANSFTDYIAGFYDHPQEYLDSRGKTSHAGKMIKTSMADSSMKSVLSKSIETTHIMTILSIEFPEPKAENAMIGARKLKEAVKIGVIYTDMTISECLLGSWYAEDSFGNANSIVLQGGNHLVMMHRPDDFWAAVLQVS